MKSISVLTGVRFQPEHFLQHMKKSKKFSYIDFSYVDTLYSPCWVFQLRVAIPVTKSVKRYAGYYAGFEESTMTPGKLSRLPGSHPVEVAEQAILPSRLRRIAMELPETDKKRAEEFRLRAGHCLSVLLPEGERSLEAIVTTEELETLCDIAAEFSRYASIETLRQGFLPVRGGFRVGLCGSAVVKDGEVTNLKQISSAVIRISREQKGIAQAVAPRLFRDGRFVSTLLLSPPGGGKTTLLRDLVRQLSQGEGVPPQRITLIDEREEIAVMYRGQPQMDVGPRTDVLSGCPKALAIPMALRAMNPQIIAVDEITVREDLRAISQAAGCGVALLATIHAANVEELQAKPLYQELLAGRVFRQAVLIRTGPEGRLYAVENLP